MDFSSLSRNLRVPAPWTSQITFGVSSSNLCYAVETTIVHFSLLCFIVITRTLLY